MNTKEESQEEFRGDMQSSVLQEFYCEAELTTAISQYLDIQNCTFECFLSNIEEIAAQVYLKNQNRMKIVAAEAFKI